MRVPVSIYLDTDTDLLVVHAVAADGEGDVTLLELDVKQLSTSEKHKLRHIRDENQPQREPGDVPATRRG